MKSHDIPEIYLPFPLVFYEGKLYRSAHMTDRERKDWRAEMVAISVGQYDFELLAERIQYEREKLGLGWKEEKELEDTAAMRLEAPQETGAGSDPVRENPIGTVPTRENTSEADPAPTDPTEAELSDTESAEGSGVPTGDWDPPIRIEPVAQLFDYYCDRLDRYLDSPSEENKRDLWEADKAYKKSAAYAEELHGHLMRFPTEELNEALLQDWDSGSPLERLTLVQRLAQARHDWLRLPTAENNENLLRLVVAYYEVLIHKGTYTRAAYSDLQMENLQAAAETNMSEIEVPSVRSLVDEREDEGYRGALEDGMDGFFYVPGQRLRESPTTVPMRKNWQGPLSLRQAYTMAKWKRIQDPSPENMGQVEELAAEIMSRYDSTNLQIQAIGEPTPFRAYTHPPDVPAGVHTDPALCSETPDALTAYEQRRTEREQRRAEREYAAREEAGPITLGTEAVQILSQEEIAHRRLFFLRAQTGTTEYPTESSNNREAANTPTPPGSAPNERPNRGRGRGICKNKF